MLAIHNKHDDSDTVRNIMSQILVLLILKNVHLLFSTDGIVLLTHIERLLKNHVNKHNVLLSLKKNVMKRSKL